MDRFVAPVIDCLIKLLEHRLPSVLGSLPPFVDVGLVFTGIAVNFPALWVMPVRTAFDPEREHTRAQVHEIRVKFGITAPDANSTADLAMAYMAAIDSAITQSSIHEWNATMTAPLVRGVFIRSHDYGPLYERGGVLARFPELELLVETEELCGELFE